MRCPVRPALGPLFTTFSIVGRCGRTGRLGIAIATQAIAVASRCPFVKAGVGAVATQANTDPRLGSAALTLLERGLSASHVIEDLVRGDPHSAYRQLGVVDRAGNAAAVTGSAARPWAGHRTGPNVVAMGNVLTGQSVVDAMFETFRAWEPDDLEERLMRALEAGRDAGGQHGGQRSSGLLVTDRAEYAWVDLRVDEHEEPIAELRRVFELYKPLREYFNLRPSRPEIGPPDEWLATGERR